LEGQRLYFPNLNGLRLIAAAMVFIHHLEHIKSKCNIHNYWENYSSIKLMGKIGVVFFFVLSGFLITYIILNESNSVNINFKRFYLKRFLRIYPLYILIVFLSFFLFSKIQFSILPIEYKDLMESNFYKKLVLYILIFPNFVSNYGVMPFSSHTWSIGVELQFYLFWPFFLFYFKRNKLKFILWFIFIFIFFRLLADFYENDFSYLKQISSHMKYNLRFDSMAVGGIFAVLYIQKNKFLSLFQNIWFFYFILFFTLCCIAFGIRFPYINYEFYSFLFAILILNFALNKKLEYALEFSTLSFLGKISYGIYMTHPISIVIGINICSYFGILSDTFILIITASITVVLSTISYYFLELYFLKLKNI
jgi:peptidoglycan/LPS O-acetylase OafA/YrhL